ncbi:MAG: phenylalanine--tRNA ligase subunit beta [Bacteroidetes bacterium]|nr:MAG: phenylalanine--tRNA ligase subunit beta [Bacteroidota bacterium]
MNLSYNWLKKYIAFDVTPKKLDEILTDCGLEVEKMERVQSIKGGLEGIIIGKVMSCEKHPNADTLSITTVDIGNGTILPIVCGAPNVAAGQKVPVATVGTTLYDGDNTFKIKKSKIRGEVSEGMICAEDELGLGSMHDGIMVLDDSAEIGSYAKDYFKIEDDYRFEIGLTPNRSDATSHIGSARDLVAVFNQLYGNRDSKLILPDVTDFKIDNTNLDIDVIVEDTEACPRYSGLTLSNIEVKESPEWLKNALKTIDIRPINNIVDITNFVMYETGQPLHAFDADAVTGNKVIVKKLDKGSKFVTLDEVERELSANDLMICNAQEGMCIAGVFGGLSSGITKKTKRMFLESAYFEPTGIRKTAKFHGLKTDASFRYERGADPNITTYALKRAAILIKELANADISSEIKDVYPNKIEPWQVSIKYSNVSRLIGKEIPVATIKTILTDLDIKILEETENGLLLEIPTFKVDVTREADIIEEILRIYGYNNIDFSESVHSALSYGKKPDKEKLQNLISDYLSNNGFAETMNNSLTKSVYYENNPDFDALQSVKMLNPLSSDLNILRQSLMYGGLEVVLYNINRKNPDLKIYEFGKSYKLVSPDAEKVEKRYSEEKHLSLLMTGKKAPESWSNKADKVNFYDLKQAVQHILKKLQFNLLALSVDMEIKEYFSEGLRFSFNNKPLVEFGELSPKTLKSFGIKQAVFYADFNWQNILKAVKQYDIQFKEVPKFPVVRRDLALVLDKTVKFESIEALAYKVEKRILKSVNLFDIYEGKELGEGKKSYSISFLLQNSEKTLNDKQIDKMMKRFIQMFEKDLGAIIRR